VIAAQESERRRLGADPGLPSSGYGMPSMAERAELVGGTTEVRSRPGAGTAVTVIVPIDGPTGS
jgi:signal transduction histidine kinase